MMPGLFLEYVGAIFLEPVFDVVGCQAFLPRFHLSERFRICSRADFDQPLEIRVIGQRVFAVVHLGFKTFRSFHVELSV
jgi:hypothetical protein